MSDPPANTTQPKDRRNIVWDDSNARNVYSDQSTVSATREEISLLFGTSQAGQRDENTVTVELTDGIAMSPFVAKRLSILLQNVVKNYETKFGKLDVEPGRPTDSTLS